MLLTGAVALLAALAFASASATASAALDTHSFPRTFHVYSCDDPTKLARYDMVVGFSYCDLPKMRSLNPTGLFLLQPTLNGKMVHLTYGAEDTWTGGCDSIVDGSAANLGCIPAFDPAWDQLKNADGSMAVLGSYGTDGFNHADPMKHGSSQKIAKIYAYAAKNNSLYRSGWNGLYSDNYNYSAALCSTWFFGLTIDTDRNGTADCSGSTTAAALRRNWDDGVVSFGNSLRKWFPGKIVGGNTLWYGNPEKYRGSTPNGWRSSGNFMHIENTQTFVDPATFLERSNPWLHFADPYGMPRYVATLHAAPKCGGGTLSLPTGGDPNSTTYILNSCVMRGMRRGLTLALLAGAYYEMYLHYQTKSIWWYDEYDGGVGIAKRGYLGQPRADAVRLSSGVWRRDFDNGIALNNPTSAAKTVSLGGTFKHLLGTQNPALNNGSLASSVTVPTLDGVILLRSSTPAFAVWSKTLKTTQVVSGSVRWEASTTGASISKVEFSIDGSLRSTERAGPYVYNGDTGTWNTTGFANGVHTLTLKAIATDGRVTSSSIAVVVAN